MKQLTFATLMFLLYIGCKKKETSQNHDCLNDPCCGKSEIKTDFSLSDELGNHSGYENIYISEIEKITYGKIKLTSKTTGANSYKWYFNGQSHTGNEATFDLFGLQKGRFYSFSHVVEKNPDLNCFPLDDGKDSLTKTYYLVKDLYELDVNANYRGKFKHLNNDSFDFSIKFVDPDHIGQTFVPGGYLVKYDNIQNDGKSIVVSSPPCTNTYIRLDGERNSPKGELFLNRVNNKVYVKYQVDGSFYEINGRKLN